jgi:predicted nuclease of predicted toxin-antitoxin system
MRFIVDAQLPRKVTRWLSEPGHDAIYNLYLPNKNNTQDAQIIALSMLEERIVITKDSDFYDSYILRQEPYKLLIITTGNITNTALIALLERNFEQLLTLLAENSVVEIDNKEIFVHF